MQLATASSRDEVPCGRCVRGRTCPLSPSLPALLPVSLTSLLFAFCFLLSSFFFPVKSCCVPGEAPGMPDAPGSFPAGGISPECRAPSLCSAVIRVPSFSLTGGR